MTVDIDTLPTTIDNVNYAALDRQLNSATTPLAARFRALFTLKSIATPQAIEIIGKGMVGCFVNAASHAETIHTVRLRRRKRFART